MTKRCDPGADGSGGLPDFTIVTPSYNYGRYIRDCIESVLCQEGVTVEHIIQDACSTDDTHAILEEYPHLKVHIEKDSGMSEGINRGFRKARGRWVMWLNTDDVLKPGALKAVKDVAMRCPDADVIHGGWEFVDDARRHLRSMKALPCRTGILIYYGCYLASTALFLKRETTIDEGFLLNERFRFSMDGEYYIRLAKAGKRFQAFNKVLAEFRWHDCNLSGLNLQHKDIDAELLRQRQLAENRAATRTYGRYFSSCWSVNDITDALLYQYFRFYKAFLLLTSPWEDGSPGLPADDDTQRH